MSKPITIGVSTYQFRLTKQDYTRASQQHALLHLAIARAIDKAIETEPELKGVRLAARPTTGLHDFYP